MNDRYAVEYHPNKACATFHFTQKMTDLSSSSAEPHELREALLAIPGVVDVHGYAESVTITRGGAYVWDDLEAEVVAVVGRHIMLIDLVEVATYRGHPYLFAVDSGEPEEDVVND